MCLAEGVFYGQSSIYLPQREHSQCSFERDVDGAIAQVNLGLLSRLKFLRLHESTTEFTLETGNDVIKRQSKHYGTKSGHFKTSKIHFPTSEGVSEVSERANE